MTKVQTVQGCSAWQMACCAPGHEPVTNPDGLQPLTKQYIATAIEVLAKERTVIFTSQNPQLLGRVKRMKLTLVSQFSTLVVY